MYSLSVACRFSQSRDHGSVNVRNVNVHEGGPLDESNLTPTITIQALEAMTDFVAFERLCCDILAGYGGYPGMAPQGIGRKDGGKDAVLIDRSDSSQTTVYRYIVFHFSLRDDFHRKLREDLVKVRKRNLQPNCVVFVTNHRWTPTGDLGQDEFKRWCKAEYGWNLEIYDQEWLQIPLEGEYQAIRKRYLGIDYDLSIFQDLEDRLNIPHRHPNRKDLETGVYYRRDSLHEAVHHHLRERNYCLILGKPGQGKTALAIAVGFDFLQSNPNHSVFYVSAKQHGSCRDWLAQIRRANHPHVWYIIDDCHASIDAVNELIEHLHTVDRSKLLLVSRAFDPDRAGNSDENFLEILEPVTVALEVDTETVRNIIKGLGFQEDIPAEVIGDLSAIIKRCEGDLYLLNFIVYTWRHNIEKPKSLAEVPEEWILDEVFRRYLGGSPEYLHQHIRSIVALSQFEIPMQADWFGDEQTIYELQEDAWIDSYVTEINGQPIRFMQYFHSTPARLLLQACYKKGRLGCDTDGFTLGLLRSYLSSKPANFFELFRQLYINGRIDLQNRLFEDGLPFRVLDLMYKDAGSLLTNRMFQNFCRFAYAVWLWEGKPRRGTASRLLKSSLTTYNDLSWQARAEQLQFQVIAPSLQYLPRIDLNFTKKLIEALQFNELGQQAHDASLCAVRNFMTTTSRLGVNLSRVKEFFSAFNFENVGRRTQSHQSGLATIKNFLKQADKIGVDGDHLKEFCNCLNFLELGERSCDVGLTTLKNFLDLVNKVGVDRDRLKQFCNCLNFPELGERSCDAGLTTITMFLRQANKVGVDGDRLKQFCNSLNLPELGERSCDVGLASIGSFLRQAYKANADDDRLKQFCNHLNFLELGKQSHKAGLAAFVHFIFMFNRYATWSTARDFVKGVGWDRIKTLAENDFAPEAVAALRLLLIRKCEYSLEEIATKGIDLSAESKIWFKSFCQGTLPSRRELDKSEVALRGYSLNHVKRQHGQRYLSYDSIDLKAWNILIRNICSIDSEYFEQTIVPVLSSFSRQKFEFLFRDSDLKNLGIFLSFFGQETGGLAAEIFQDIEYDRIDLHNKIDGAALLEISHFLFSPRAVGLENLVTQTSQYIQKQWETFIPRVEDADLKTVEFFLWNLMLALPSGEKLRLPAPIVDAIEAKIGTSPVDQPSLLGVLGILDLIEDHGAHLRLSSYLSGQQAIKICRDASTNPEFRLIRLLAGLKSLSAAPPTEENVDLFRAGLNSLDLSLTIPRQEDFLDRLHEWLGWVLC